MVVFVLWPLDTSSHPTGSHGLEAIPAARLQQGPCHREAAATWKPGFEAVYRGPKDQIGKRILHPGSKVQYKRDTRNHVL